MCYCTAGVTCGDLQLHKQVVSLHARVELQVECASCSRCCVQDWKPPPLKKANRHELTFITMIGVALAPESWRRRGGVAVVTGHMPAHLYTERLH